MPMNYNPQDYDPNTEPARAKPGTYRFRVDDAGETVFQSGNEGVKLTLKVAALPNRDITVFDNLVYTASALWKVRQFLASLGFDFDRPPEVHELVGRFGQAKFALSDRGYLQVGEYLPASANNGPDSRRLPRQQASRQQPASQPGRAPAADYDYGPPPMGDEDVPF